ncbi:unnamed protein product, partial [Discosporangium mesarthrocarpum]
EDGTRSNENHSSRGWCSSPRGGGAFTLLQPLWALLLEDTSPEVRALAAQGALSAAHAASLPQLREAGDGGKRVLRLLADMLATGDPEAARVVAGRAGIFVADGGKVLQALYLGGVGSAPQAMEVGKKGK